MLRLPQCYWETKYTGPHYVMKIKAVGLDAHKPSVGCRKVSGWGGFWSFSLRGRVEAKPFDTYTSWKQTSGDPSGQTWNYCGITLLYNFTTALLYMVSSVTMARIVARLLNIY